MSFATLKILSVFVIVAIIGSMGVATRLTSNWHEATAARERISRETARNKDLMAALAAAEDEKKKYRELAAAEVERGRLRQQERDEALKAFADHKGRLDNAPLSVDCTQCRLSPERLQILRSAITRDRGQGSGAQSTPAPAKR